jgi:hypothetical protein
MHITCTNLHTHTHRRALGVTIETQYGPAVGSQSVNECIEEKGLMCTSGAPAVITRSNVLFIGGQYCDICDICTVESGARQYNRRRRACRPMSLYRPGASSLPLSLPPYLSFCVSACAGSCLCLCVCVSVSLPEFMTAFVPPSRAFFPHSRLYHTIHPFDPSDEIHYFRPDWRFDLDRWLRYVGVVQNLGPYMRLWHMQHLRHLPLSSRYTATCG